MKKILFIIIIFISLQSCTPRYMWMQRKVKLTETGYVPAGDWQELDTTGAQPIYQLKKIRIKKVYGYGH